MLSYCHAWWCFALECESSAVCTTWKYGVGELIIPHARQCNSLPGEVSLDQI